MDINNAYQLISGKLLAWLHDLIRLLPNILLAAVILVTGFFIAKWIRKLAAKLISKISHHAALNNLFESIVYIFFIGITLFTVLSVLQLDKAVTSILAGAGILGLALAFAFQDIAANFISGIFISFRSPIQIGDVVKIKDYMGKVEEINLRDTVIRTFQGQMVIIPNKDVFQNPIENFSLLGKRRFDLSIGISYGDDLEKVSQVTLAAVKGIEGLSEDDEIAFFYKEFGDSSINFQLRMWVNSPEQLTYIKAGSEAIMRIKKAFDDNDIMIPFPIRTLDFGIKGGVPWNEQAIKTNVMNLKKRIAVYCIYFFCFIKMSTAQNRTPPEQICGKWESTEKNLIISISLRNGQYRAVIDWFSDTEGKPLDYWTDQHNPDPALRSRKIHGMNIIQKLAYHADTRSWEDGMIYDSKHGKEWNAAAYIGKKGLLHVRGYWHFKFMGKTMTFSRI